MKQAHALDQADGDERLPVNELYRTFARLEDAGWVAETIALSSRERNGRPMSLPIPSFRTKKTGPAVWVISGIHGEEPAGPNAIAAGIDIISRLGEQVPVVLLPLCNPLGYASGWRYLDRPDWQEGAPVMSAGDSEHLLPDLKAPSQPRTGAPSSPEAAALSAHVLRMAKSHPPAMSFDFHEDSLIGEGYIYSQGRRGVDDEIARQTAKILQASGIPMKASGNTRFGEEIVDGTVGPQHDGSIDELMAAEIIISDGKRERGPAAATVIVIETPAAMRLHDRRRAHLAVLERLSVLAAHLRP